MRNKYDKIQPLEGNCDFLVRGIGLSIQAINDKKLASYELTNSQGRLLGIIYNDLKEGREISRRYLQGLTHVSGPAITGLLNGLEKKGFIVRSAGLEDGRTMDIKVTAKGEKLINEMESTFKATERQLLSGMTEDEIVSFKRLLSRAFHNVSTER